MDIPTALAILEDAVKRCMTENVTTPEIVDALGFLSVRSEDRWPFVQFHNALTAKEGETDLDRGGRRQVLNASLNAIKRAVKGMGGAARETSWKKTFNHEGEV